MRSSVLRGLSVTVSSAAFVALCSIASLTINARALGPEDFGVLAVTQAYVALIASITTFESWQAVIRIGAARLHRLGLTLSSAMLLDGIAAIVATTLAAGGVVLLSRFSGVADEHRAVALIYSTSLLAGIAGTPKGYFRLIGRFDLLARNQVANGLLMLTASGLLAIFEAPLLLYSIAFSAIAVAYNGSIYVRFLLHSRGTGVTLQNPIKGERRRRFFLHVFEVASGTSLLSTLVNARKHMGLFLTTAFLGSSASGMYAAASRIASVASRASGPLNQVLFPEIIRSTRSEGARRWSLSMQKLTALTAVASLAVTGAAVLVSPLLTVIFLGAEYIDAADLIPALVAIECLALGSIHLNATVQAAAGTRPLILQTAAALSLLPVLSYVLAPVLGASGIALAGLVCTALTYFGMLMTARRA